VVVVGQGDAVGLEVGAEGVELLGVGFPLGDAFELRAARQRGLLLALHRAGDFAVDHHRAAVVHQFLEVCLHGFDFVVEGVLGQGAGVPAGDHHRAVAGQLDPQFFRVLREFVAQLEALVADLGAFDQACLQRRVAAQLRQVIVRPRDRVDPNAYFQFAHVCLFFD
jgi:hypothetical protein